ncbi:MAG: PAS domain S-box protein [Bacteroidetes bacterium]|nr:PAS domain S-box protein [Bacteroidota bacterium]
MSDDIQNILFESSPEFQILFQGISLVIIILSKKGLIEMVNRYTESIFGYNADELTGNSIEQLVPMGIHQMSTSPMALHKNGSMFPVEVNLSKFTNDRLLVFIKDIEKPKAEETLLTTHEQLFKQLIMHMPAAVAIFDTNMRYMMVSKHWMEDYRLGNRNIIGLSHYEVFPEIGEKWKSLHRRCLQGEVFHCNEEKFVRANGDIDWIRWELSPWYTASNEIGGAILCTENISERKQAEQELQKLNNNLEKVILENTKELIESLHREKEFSELKSRFVSTASHEFRTPLTAILSSAFLIETYKTTEQEEERKRHIERIKSSVRNLSDILNDFLSLDKIEQGIVTVSKESFDLSVFLECIVEEMRGLLKEGQQIMLAYYGKRNITLDKMILKNILLNLLSNAIKYSNTYTNIHLSAEVTNNLISISVKDEGIGIPKDEQNKLFNRFFRAKNVLSIQGTGLGLNIAKKYAALLNGSITFHSTHFVGTTFTVTFPQNTN